MKEKVYYIYMTTNLINNKKYIGQHKGYIDDNYLGSGTTITKAIQKYGRENFSKTIIEICSPSNIDEREKYWIKKYNAVEDKNFYNNQEGGTGGDGWRACQNWMKNNPSKAKQIYKANGENLQKWVKANPELSKQNTEIMLSAAREWQKNNPDKVKQHMKQVNKKKIQWQKEHPDEYKKQVDAWRRAGSEANSQKILCITTNKIFSSISEAARFYNTYQTNISKVLSGERKSAGRDPETGKKLFWKKL